MYRCVAAQCPASQHHTLMRLFEGHSSLASTSLHVTNTATYLSPLVIYILENEVRWLFGIYSWLYGGLDVVCEVEARVKIGM